MNIFNYPLSVILGISLMLFFGSCAKEEVATSNEASIIPEEALAKLSELGFGIDNAEVISFTNPLTGETSPVTYKVEGDIMITPAELNEMANGKVMDAPMTEQYRTSNLVSSPRTIRVLGYTGGSNALDNSMRQAIQLAVQNYNQLNIGLNFTLTFGSANYRSYDIVVYRVGGSGGGSAGFPTGGRPYQYVQIQSGTTSFGVNVLEHVITHEIGHCVGLRHTDYFNRSLSCGSGGNEGQAGVGAINIPGTPTGTDSNSIMQACFRLMTTGNLASTTE